MPRKKAWGKQYFKFSLFKNCKLRIGKKNTRGELVTSAKKKK